MAVIARDPPNFTDSARVVWLDWPDYLGWLEGKIKRTWTAWGELVDLGPPAEPGQHDALIGPTGEGKSTHAVGRLGSRKYVLALDPKGEDETLSASGYVRVSSLYKPGPRYRARHWADARVWDDIWKRVRDGRDARVIIGGPADDDEQFARLRALMQEAVGFCRYAGGWTLYCDEFEVLSSREMFNLAAAVNLALITARRKAVSVMNSYQAQAWVSKHAIRQARRATLWPTGDRDMIINVSRGMGRDWHEVAEAVDLLPPFHTLTIPRGKRGGPMVITHAPKLPELSTTASRERASARSSSPGRQPSPDRGGRGRVV